ncbi:HTH-type transcriptional regulator CdhR [Corynebacterium faecale]|uniref:GlxA family transcriptional regulator n=1 Tax=Corynebacterium faecale TaxID=1758466 RepID=UPI0025B38C97|nr:DJ-1/PfpI family protein [Corynebacterium faecale]WJY91277.1 HTH-type transcriptional regulator CdhR [Corynebacterium faecale]
MKKMALLIYDGVTMLDVSGPAEALSRAEGYELTLLSPTGGAVTTAAGITLSQTRQASTVNPRDFNTVIIAGADELPMSPIPRELLDATRHLADGPQRVASVCTGAFILAELGYLNGRRATTHWRNALDLARRFPLVRVQPDTLHVHDGKFITSAGITAGIDLSLSLIEEDQGADVARRIARDMVMFMHRPGGQSQFAAATNSPSVSNPILQNVLETIREKPDRQHTIASLASDAAVSPRHLGRLFREELGTTPTGWLEQFRLSIAQQLILDGHTVTAAARKSGFSSDDSMRRAFERRLHSTPSEYRARFSSTFRSKL